MMNTFRKKPVVIEAMQYTTHNRQEIIKWTGCHHIRIDDDGGEYETEGLLIRTLEGEMQADLNDWIIKGVNGEFYPCKPDIFEKSYESASTEPEELEGRADVVWVIEVADENDVWSVRWSHLSRELVEGIKSDEQKALGLPDNKIRVRPYKRM